MARKPLISEVQPPDILSADEIAEVERQVAQDILEEDKAQARKALKAKLRAKARKDDGTEPTTQVTIDLAPYCDRLLIDNVAYLQGVTYTVTAAKAAVMREQMQRTWNHQAEIDGKNENFYRRQRGARVVPVGEHGAAVINTTSQLLKA